MLLIDDTGAPYFTFVDGDEEAADVADVTGYVTDYTDDEGNVMGVCFRIHSETRDETLTDGAIGLCPESIPQFIEDLQALYDAYMSRLQHNPTLTLH